MKPPRPILPRTYNIRCSHPNHADNSAWKGWNNGILGTTTVQDHDHGLICPGCHQYDLINTVPAISQEQTLADLRSQVADAKSYEDIKAALVQTLNMLDPRVL